MSTKKTPGIVFNHDDDSHAALVLKIRAAINAAADDIEAGRVDLDDPKAIANVLRNAASSISVEQGGKARRFDHGSMKFVYGWYRHHEKLTHDEAKKRLAEEFDVSPQAVTDCLTPENVEAAMAQYKGSTVFKKMTRVQYERHLVILKTREEKRPKKR